MPQPKLYRNRLIPLESILLDQDRILSLDANSLITSWQTLKPKSQLAYGYSYYLIDRGIKISRMYDHENNFLYWYCDIIETTHDPETNTYVFTDLLVDVRIDPDGSYYILDLDEVKQALSENLLSTEQLAWALTSLHNLLQDIYDHSFDSLVKPLLIKEEEYPPEKGVN